MAAPMDKKQARAAPATYKDTYGREYQLPSFTMKEIYQSIPAECFERSYVRSFSYVARDLALIGVLGYTAATYIPRLPYLGLRVLAYMLYSVLQGLFCTGVWVLAHECGHGAFSPSKTVNDVVGWVLHSALLVPYFSWKFSHSQHHKNTGHLHRDTVFVPKTRADRVQDALPPAEAQDPSVTARLMEDSHDEEESGFYHLVEETPLATAWFLLAQQLGGWIMYLFTNVTGQKYPGAWGVNHFNPGSPLFSDRQRWAIVYSDIGLSITLLALGFATRTFGFVNVMLYYGIPYLWVNHWLVLITYLQHTDPALPHYRNGEWTFERGAAATIDRDFGFIGRHLLHGIIETHVLHHLCSRIPFYRADEATRAIRKVMGDAYLRDETNLLVSLWRTARMCQWVENTGDVVFYRNAHRLGANWNGRYGLESH